MYLATRRRLLFLMAGLACAGIVAVYFWPLAAAVPESWSNVKERFDWAGPYVLTISVAFTSTIASILLGFLGAFLLRGAKYHKSWVLLILPLLGGDAAFGFSWLLIKESWGDGGLIIEREWLNIWGLLSLIETWQLAPLCLFVILVALKARDSRYREIKVSLQLEPGEEARYLAFGQIKLIAWLLAAFCMAKGMQEYGKAYLVLKPSEGTESELVSHWLHRLYYMALRSPHETSSARDVALEWSAAAMLSGAVISLVGAAVAVLVVKWITPRLISALKAVATARPRPILSRVIAGVVCLPLLLPTIRHFSVHNLQLSFLYSFIYSIMAGLLCTVVAGVCAAVLRIGTLHGQAGKFSLMLVASPCLLMVAPPIGLVAASYASFERIGLTISSPITATMIWLLGQSVSAFPVVLAFALVAAYRVSSNEIDSLLASEATIRQVLRVSFWRRLQVDYGLLVGIATMVVYVEHPINSMLSGQVVHIPSFAMTLEPLMDGRGASFGQASQMLMITYMLVAMTLLLWSVIFSQASEEERGIHP